MSDTTPEPEPGTVAVPATTEEGLEAATEIYQRGWSVSQTVPFWLPLPVARRIFGDRGWQQVCNPDGATEAWQAPNGTTYLDIDEALKHALAAESAGNLPALS